MNIQPKFVFVWCVVILLFTNWAQSLNYREQYPNARVARHKIKFISKKDYQTKERNGIRIERRLAGKDGLNNSAVSDKTNKSKKEVKTPKSSPKSIKTDNASPKSKKTTPKASNVTDKDDDSPKSNKLVDGNKSGLSKSIKSLDDGVNKSGKTKSAKTNNSAIKSKKTNSVVGDSNSKSEKNISKKSLDSKGSKIVKDNESEESLRSIKSVDSKNKSVDSKSKHDDDSPSLKDSLSNSSDKSLKSKKSGDTVSNITGESKKTDKSEVTDKSEKTDKSGVTDKSGNTVSNVTADANNSEIPIHEDERSKSISEIEANQVSSFDRFEHYDEERQKVMRDLLKRIEKVYLIEKEKREELPDNLQIELKEDNYIEFRLEGAKYYLMHLSLEYKDYAKKHFAVMNSDDFVDRSRSVLYISEKRLEDQKDHLVGHLEEFINFYNNHANNRKEFEELEDQFEQKFQEVFQSNERYLNKVVDTKNYKMMKIALKGEMLKNGSQMTNIFRLYIYKLDSKHFMIDLKGEVREMSMITKIFLNREELEEVINKVVRTAEENNQHEFSWVSVPLMIDQVLDRLRAMENTDEQGSDYLQMEQIGENKEFSNGNNMIQYLVKHIPGEEEDMDEEIEITLNFYLFKDEFLPSMYFGVKNKYYESEYLVPFSGHSAEFSEMMYESIKKAYDTIKKITYELADIDEQDVYEKSHQDVVNLIKEGIAREDMCEVEDVQTTKILDTEYDGVPFLEEKIFHTEKQYFTVHNIEMEDELQGYLVNCYNLQTIKGDVGEYRIYAKNYYDCAEDFDSFITTCMSD